MILRTSHPPQSLHRGPKFAPTGGEVWQEKGWGGRLPQSLEMSHCWLLQWVLEVASGSKWSEVGLQRPQKSLKEHRLAQGAPIGSSRHCPLNLPYIPSHSFTLGNTAPSRRSSERKMYPQPPCPQLNRNPLVQGFSTTMFGSENSRHLAIVAMSFSLRHLGRLGRLRQLVHLGLLLSAARRIGK